ncbi:MAG: hypothetical protein IPO63_08485 [Bacteroidetes bacterium]|nr:hypothetical protein [Bacteroidota bacterium]
MKPTSKQGQCKLCLEVKDLCESHIIPKHVYKRNGIWTKKEKVHTLHTTNDYEFINSNTITDKSWKGEREDRFLCRDCEIRLSVFEQYVVDIFFEEITPKKYKVVASESMSPIGRAIAFTGVDYHKLKLYYLSIFWRMSLSTLPLFDYFKLSPFDNERIRQMILNNDAGKDEQFEIALFRPGVGDLPTKVLAPFLIEPISNGTGYYIIGAFGANGILLKLSDGGVFEEPFKNLMKYTALKNEKTVYISIIPDEDWKKFIFKTLRVGEILDAQFQLNGKNSF